VPFQSAPAKGNARPLKLMWQRESASLDLNETGKHGSSCGSGQGPHKEQAATYLFACEQVCERVQSNAGMLKVLQLRYPSPRQQVTLQKRYAKIVGCPWPCPWENLQAGTGPLLN